MKQTDSPLISFQILLFLLMLGISFSNNCFGRTLEEIRKSGKIYVALTEWDYRNINYPLAKELAKYLNVKLVEVPIRWDEAFSLNGKIPADLETNPDLDYTPDALKKADIICSTFSMIEWRKKLFDFAETLISAELLISTDSLLSPEKAKELNGKAIAYMKTTTFEQHLIKLNKEIGGGIRLRPVETTDDSKNLLLQGKVYGIVLDADEVLTFNASNRNRFHIVFPVSPVTNSAWAVEKGNLLGQVVADFFETIRRNGILDQIFLERFQVKYSNFVGTIKKTSRPVIVYRDLDEIRKSGKIIVAFRERNFVYSLGENKQFMHALAEEFANFLGVKMDFVIVPGTTKYWENNQGSIRKDSSYNPVWFNYFDIACDIFTIAPWRTNKVNLVPLFPTEYMVVARKKTIITDLQDLSKLEGVTARGTVYEDLLQRNGIHKFHYADIDRFLEEVNSGKADYAIILNSFFELTSFPDLEGKISLGESDICWALRKDQPQLENALESFIRESRTKGLIRILEKTLTENSLQSTERLISNYFESIQTGQLPMIHYGQEDGLPGKEVTAILQDKNGFMWFGTKSGLAKYNSRRMEHIQLGQNAEANSIRDLALDDRGNIWVASDAGLHIISGNKLQKSIFPDIAFMKVKIDHSQTIWGILHSGLIQVNEQGRISILHKENPVLNTRIFDILHIPSIHAWLIASGKGLFILDGNGNLNELYSDTCYALYLDIQNKIWISSRNGIHIADGNQLYSEDLMNPSKSLNNAMGLPVGEIKNIVPSEYGSVWLVSEKKLFHVVSPTIKAIDYNLQTITGNFSILSFFEDVEANLWIGYNEGIQRIPDNRGLRNFFPSQINRRVLSVFQDRQDRIWISSENGLFYYKDNLVFANHQFDLGTENSFAAQLPNGQIIIANRKKMMVVSSENLNVVRSYSFSQEVPPLTGIFVSNKSEIFLLSGKAGKIFYLRHPGEKPMPFENKITQNVSGLIEVNGDIIGGNYTGLILFSGLEWRQLSVLGCPVNSLCLNDNILWIGSDCGLMMKESEEISKLEFTKRNGISVTCIIPAKNRNYLWIGTNKGVYYLNKISGKEEFILNTGDGLQNNEITPHGLMVDKDGLLWSGTLKGLSNFNIHMASASNKAPVCYIERILVNGIPIDPELKQSFKRKENNLSFEISALSFSDEHSVEYEFYLRGLENAHSSYQIGKNYSLNCISLPPGKYELIYKAKGKNGIWGYAQKFEFKIRKAWYQLWFVYVGLIFIVITGIYSFLFYTRNKDLKNKETDIDSLVERRLDDLQRSLEELEGKR